MILTSRLTFPTKTARGHPFRSRLGGPKALFCPLWAVGHFRSFIRRGSESFVSSTRARDTRVMGYYPGAGWLRVARTDETDSSSPGAGE
jgi:hypothetical protein